MDHESLARGAHRSGSNCANAVYHAFDDVNPAPGAAPAPRSEGGQCGAVLAAKKLMRDMGIEGDVEQYFLEAFGALKCAELRRRRIPCNDLVGAAAHFIDTAGGAR